MRIRHVLPLFAVIALLAGCSPIQSRTAGHGGAERFSGAFNDPASAPDVAEFGNTDTAGYAARGALADLSGDLASWPEGTKLQQSVVDTAKVDGKLYGLPWYTGIRALYYRTDVFAELGLQPPKTLAELTGTARRIRAVKPDLYGPRTRSSSAPTSARPHSART